ncbi:MAG TPA: hypothetical protein VEG30_09385 [Terriglobales bacterium]|nr:hypothetical protein [Terriglobales bacterium]
MGDRNTKSSSCPIQRWLWIVAVALAVASCVPCLAQVSDVYLLTYYNQNYSNLGVFSQFSSDQTVRIVNPGVQREICADLFVFDNQQEMLECCACRISANGLLTLSLQYNLLQAPLVPGSGFFLGLLNSGVIKIVSDHPQNCDPTSPVPVRNLRAWMSHVQGTTISDQAFDSSVLMQGELLYLGQTCGFIENIGVPVGVGVCTCPTGA